MIEIRKLSKLFDKIEALKEISLTLPAGQNHVVIGSSGSGKTTLLRLLLGLEKPTEGSIFLSNKDLSQEKPALEDIGYMPQSGGLFPHMTAAENVRLVAKLQNWEEKKIATRQDELTQLIGLDEEILQRYPSQLSGGQKQRVSLMRALFLNPALLVLDEPLGALDPLIRFDLQTELAAVFTRLKKTVIIVTHDLSEAIFFGDTITLLHEGELIQTGSFQDLSERPAAAFVTKFLQAQRPSNYRAVST